MCLKTLIMKRTYNWHLSNASNVTGYLGKTIVKNNFSWKDILAVPPNLLSFCISSTFNVLRSPSNLTKHWKVNNDSSCVLCRKELCTIPHILGACKFSLNQGRFSFILNQHTPKELTKFTLLKQDKNHQKSKETQLAFSTLLLIGY